MRRTYKEMKREARKTYYIEINRDGVYTINIKRYDGKMVSFKDICYIRKVYNRYTPHNKSDGIITTPVFVEAAYLGLSQMKNRKKKFKKYCKIAIYAMSVMTNGNDINSVIPGNYHIRIYDSEMYYCFKYSMNILHLKDILNVIYKEKEIG